MWKWLSPFFIFTTNERKAVITILLASVVAILAPKTYIYFIASNDKREFSKADRAVLAFMKEYEDKQLAQLAEDTSGDESYRGPIFDTAGFKYRPKEKKAIVYFAFDPNLIGEEEWMKLGLSAKQAAVVENYKVKGGKFRTPEDIRKIKVISEQKAGELIPYVTIVKVNELQKWADQPKTVWAEKPKLLVDINQADSTAFDMLRGIGPSLARRIISYRERLGGFVAVNQISEVWQMSDSTYHNLKDRFTLTSIPIRKLNINNADVEIMKKHPYLNYYHAKAIVAYRTANGEFKKLEELKEVHTITDSAFQKILPYISLN
jgi:competence ComEA-like helix-hairpin-helix protein